MNKYKTDAGWVHHATSLCAS